MLFRQFTNKIQVTARHIMLQQSIALTLLDHSSEIATFDLEAGAVPNILVVGDDGGITQHGGGDGQDRSTTHLALAVAKELLNSLHS